MELDENLTPTNVALKLPLSPMDLLWLQVHLKSVNSTLQKRIFQVACVHDAQSWKRKQVLVHLAQMVLEMLHVRNRWQMWIFNPIDSQGNPSFT